MICRANFEAFCDSRFAEFKGDRRSAIKFGAKVGMSQLEVDTIRRLAGITNQNFRKKLTKEDKEAIYKDYTENKMTYDAIGKKYGVSKVSVFYAVSKVLRDKVRKE